MTPNPVDGVRSAIERWAEARARAHRALAQGEGSDCEAVQDATRARRALGTGRVREALEEAVSVCALSDDEHGALLAQLATAARDEVIARAGLEMPHRLDAVQPFEGEARPVGALLVDAMLEPDRRRADAALRAALAPLEAGLTRRREVAEEADAWASRIKARGPRSPDEAPDDLESRAARFLEATDDAMREALLRAGHAQEIRDPRTVLDAFRALRMPALDPLVPVRERGRRIASFLAPLGFDAPLASRARLDPPPLGLFGGAHAIALDPPRAVVVVPPALELGLASEIEVARATGEALAHLLVAPALPVEFRRAVPASTARGFGELFAGLLADPLFGKKVRALEGAELEAFRRGAVAILLARARVRAARWIARRVGDRDRLEAGAVLLARALGVREPAPWRSLADPVSLDPDGDAARLRAALAAPAIAMALRERYDEDWFRNPRVAEPLRAAATRGGTLAVERWAEEVGAAQRDPARWWNELAA